MVALEGGGRGGGSLMFLRELQGCEPGETSDLGGRLVYRGAVVSSPQETPSDVFQRAGVVELGDGDAYLCEPKGEVMTAVMMIVKTMET